MRNFKYLMIFLGFNALIASMIGINYFKKNYQKQQLIEAHLNYKNNISKVEKQTLEKIIQKKTQPIHLAAVKNPNDLQLCKILGPLTINQSNTLQVILNKALQLKSSINYQKYHHPIYQIYWNLGKNYSIAQSLFEKQKENGTMNNPKFVLSQDEDNNWIVNIAQLDLPIDNVMNIATNLAEKADKVNAGGHWQYKTLPDAYFYKFSSFNLIPIPILNSIDVMVNPHQESCS